MSASGWVIPQPNPQKHVFLKYSEDNLHQLHGECWCKPELRPDPDDPRGKKWIWFHRVLN